jgi:hypothetical protein
MRLTDGGKALIIDSRGDNFTMRSRPNGEEEGEVWLPMSDLMMTLMAIVSTACLGLYLAFSLAVSSSQDPEKPEDGTSSDAQPGGVRGFATGTGSPALAPIAKRLAEQPTFTLESQKMIFGEIPAETKLCNPYGISQKKFEKNFKNAVTLEKTPDQNREKEELIAFLRDKISRGSDLKEGKILEIRIEAGASPGWGNATPIQKAKCNMNVSFLRGWVIYDLIMSMNDVWNEHELTFLMDHLFVYPMGAAPALRRGEENNRGTEKDVTQFRMVNLSAVFEK